MPAKQWFLNIRGETFGPIGTGVVLGMLKQNRLQFTDFMWCEGLTRWMRIQDLHDFASLMPPYPTSPIPSFELIPQEAEAQGVLVPQPEPEPVAPPPPKVTKPQAASTGQTKVTPLHPKSKFRRNARVPFDGHVTVEGHGLFQSIDISGGGILLQGQSGIRISTDVKIKVESAAFDRVLDMTGVVVREEVQGGHVEFAIEFTRVNPAHKRIIHEYVTKKLSEAA